MKERACGALLKGSVDGEKNAMNNVNDTLISIPFRQ